MGLRVRLLLILGCLAIMTGCNPPKQPKPSPTPIPRWAQETEGVKSSLMANVESYRSVNRAH